MSQAVETLHFQAEAQQLLHLMVHSVYSHPDVFLRELISNASDALDRRRLAALVDPSAGAESLHIDLTADPDARTLVVADNGIGMSRAEVIALIGTIARSGTAEFLRKLEQKRAGATLIGQFGVGFYASFMVAERVILLTRKVGEKTATRWTCDGSATYTIEEIDEAPEGTSVTLHLKDEQYASELKLREIVKQFSDFITWPIRMQSEMSNELVTLNSMKAIWARSRDSVSATEYHEFYKHLTHDWNDPLRTIHFRAEGRFEFEALLFVPSHAPHDLFAKEGRHGVQLYVRRVFVMDECRPLLPGYLRWIKGVVDAQDLSVNLSRELIQQDRQLQLIRRHLVRKILGALSEMQTDDRENYEIFWQECGRKFKEGLKKHPDDRPALLELCLFNSTKSATELTTLREYVARMPSDQTAIYYLNAESLAAAWRAPHLEAFRARGHEVLLLPDAVDELWTVDLQTYRELPFQSVARLSADPPPQDTGYDALLTWMRQTLEAEVKDVRLSTRLTTSPACMVGEARDVSPQLEKMARATGQALPPVRRVLELNPAHEVVVALRAAYQRRGDDAVTRDAAQLLFGVAVLAEGGTMPSPDRFTATLTSTLHHLLR